MVVLFTWVEMPPGAGEVKKVREQLGHDVLVANARRLRMIFQSDSKNDRLDAEQLARVASPVNHKRCNSTAS